MIHILTLKLSIYLWPLIYAFMSIFFTGIFMENIKDSVESYGKSWQRWGMYISIITCSFLFLPLYIAGLFTWEFAKLVFEGIDTKTALKQWVRLWWYGEITLHRDDFDLTRFQRYEDAGNWNLQWSQKKYYDRLKAYNKVRWDELLEERNK